MSVEPAFEGYHPGVSIEPAFEGPGRRHDPTMAPVPIRDHDQASPPLSLLSKRQRQILAVVQALDAEGTPPSLANICRAAGLKAKSSAHAHVVVLERRGLVWRDPETRHVHAVQLDEHGRPTRPSQPVRPKHDLTSGQYRVFEVLRRIVDERGYPPSVREIGQAVGLDSSASVHARLTALERKGYIYRTPDSARSIRLSSSKQTLANDRPPPAYVPLVSQIAAGVPSSLEEQVQEQLPLPRKLIGDGEVFALRLQTDSMTSAGLLHGDYVVVRRQKIADDGDLVAVIKNDTVNEVTVRYLSRNDGKARLLATNPAHEPIDDSQAVILGKVVAVLRSI